MRTKLESSVSVSDIAPNEPAEPEEFASNISVMGVAVAPGASSASIVSLARGLELP
jgi:hypothetical protein